MRILQQLTTHPKFQETFLLGLMTAFCFGLSLFRVFFTQTNVFLFLNWNLFLAFVPWVVSSVVILYPRLQTKKSVIGLMLFSWLLFFPNAPYILTDLFHLRLKTAMPIWYDLVLILSFAWTGLLFGLLSLWDIEKILKKTVSGKWTALMSVVFLFAGSFGIYVGRYLRWNSWDIITEPMGIVMDIAHRFAFPMEHPRTWGMTLFLGLLLNMIYWSMRMIQRRA